MFIKINETDITWCIGMTYDHCAFVVNICPIAAREQSRAGRVTGLTRNGSVAETHRLGEGRAGSSRQMLDDSKRAREAKCSCALAGGGV